MSEPIFGKREYLDWLDKTRARLTAEGVTNEVNMIFAVGRAWEDYHQGVPRLRERQEWHRFHGAMRALKRPLQLTAEDMAYLIERLASINDPQGIRIREKLEKLSNVTASNLS